MIGAPSHISEPEENDLYSLNAIHWQAIPLAQRQAAKEKPFSWPTLLSRLLHLRTLHLKIPTLSDPTVWASSEFKSSTLTSLRVILLSNVAKELLRFLHVSSDRFPSLKDLSVKVALRDHVEESLLFDGRALAALESLELKTLKPRVDWSVIVNGYPPNTSRLVIQTSQLVYFVNKEMELPVSLMELEATFPSPVALIFPHLQTLDVRQHAHQRETGLSRNHHDGMLAGGGSSPFLKICVLKSFGEVSSTFGGGGVFGAFGAPAFAAFGTAAPTMTTTTAASSTQENPPAPRWSMLPRLLCHFTLDDANCPTTEGLEQLPQGLQTFDVQKGKWLSPAWISGGGAHPQQDPASLLGLLPPRITSLGAQSPYLHTITSLGAHSPYLLPFLEALPRSMTQLSFPVPLPPSPSSPSFSTPYTDSAICMVRALPPALRRLEIVVSSQPSLFGANNSTSSGCLTEAMASELPKTLEYLHTRFDGSSSYGWSIVLQSPHVLLSLPRSLHTFDIFTSNPIQMQHRVTLPPESSSWLPRTLTCLGMPASLISDPAWFSSLPLHLKTLKLFLGTLPMRSMHALAQRCRSLEFFQVIEAEKRNLDQLSQLGPELLLHLPRSLTALQFNVTNFYASSGRAPAPIVDASMLESLPPSLTSLIVPLHFPDSLPPHLMASLPPRLHTVLPMGGFHIVDGNPSWEVEEGRQKTEEMEAKIAARAARKQETRAAIGIGSNPWVLPAKIDQQKQ